MKNKKGFTLIELIVVVAIIGILVAILVPSISGQFDNAKETAAKANAKTFYSASQTAVTTILAGWEVKSPVTQATFAIPSIYYESGEYRVYFGKNSADSSGDVEPISNAVRAGYVSADETKTTDPADLQTVKEINKHMKLYLGENSKLTTDKGGYQLSGGTTPTPPPQPPVEPPQPPVEGEDTADPANVTMKIKTTGKNATGTFAGREYQLEVTGLTKGGKYEVKVSGKTKGSFTATGAVQTVDLKGLFAPVVITQTTTHKAEVIVVALNPANGVTAEKGRVIQDLSFYDGDGSTTNPYLICDPESLQMLSDKANNDNANFANKNYKQVATIDMKPVANFVPIGGDTIKFQGTYDGGAKADGTGHEIKNLTIDCDGYGGLFGYADKATLKNIGIGSGSTIKGKNQVGGIVGYANSTTIQNSYNSAAVTSTAANVGGIAGNVINTTIEYCYNTGAVLAMVTEAGGIAAIANTSTVRQCYNTGTISSSGDRAAGIVSTWLQKGSLENSYNTGQVKSSGFLVGGLFGGIVVSGGSVATITNSFNTGNVTGKTHVGGSLGSYSATPNSQIIFTNVLFKNTVVVTGSVYDNADKFNKKYTNISEFVNATGADRSKWDDSGKLKNPDGTLMAGPNPGGA